MGELGQGLLGDRFSASRVYLKENLELNRGISGLQCGCSGTGKVQFLQRAKVGFSYGLN